MPHHQDRPPHGNQDGGRLFRCRPRRRTRRDGGRGGAYRPGRGGTVLPCHREDHRGLQADRRTSRPPRLRLSLRARGVSAGAGSSRHRLHRPQSRRDRRDGRQDRVEEGRERRQRLHRAGLPRRHRKPGTCRHHRGRDRLSGDDQGVGRRRRQGDAHRAFVRRSRGGFRSRQVGGRLVLRRRPGVRREVHHRPAPHRDPGDRRQTRQRHLPRRARMLDPAPQPEGHRGSPVAAP